MFIGIIEVLGIIEFMVDRGDVICLKVSVGKLDMLDVVLGDSIVINGVCLIVVDYSLNYYSVDVFVEII